MPLVGFDPTISARVRSHTYALDRAATGTGVLGPIAELNDLYSSPNIARVIKSRSMRWAGHVARMGEGRGVYTVLVGRSEERNHLEDRRRREDNIKMDL